MKTDSLDDYILSHISPEPDHLRRLYRRTHLRHLYPRMCSGHLQGRLLSMISAMVSPDRILELGTYTGYSALCLAEGLREGGRLHTVEIDDEMEEELTELFGSAPGGDRITLHIGDAEEIVESIDETWDLIYIDANKRRYIEYLDAVLPRLRQGGFIIADNTLWDGKVTDTETNHDAQTLALDRFNSYVASRSDLETVILPLRDGLTLIRKSERK
ncbi:MAG: O-methyltransferase [Duncaniella sp.]|uniref:O-methyltransferase n=1 Tax=Duncaniella sp. TaxID=2518496 RepID=UPI0023CF518C|nr:O-methyltransferase [Duncaniella sp.]MDE5988128.1 O-methyltransferase [Duncaniella sp.]MDE6174678.1 O-methyltransferase [Duncaniella sp.]